MADDKPKRRIRDYAGIAALVTAAGAVAFGVVDRVGHEDKAKRMSRSIFNASRERIAVLEYRVAELEELCQPPAAPARRPAAAPAPAPRPTAAHRPAAPRADAPAMATVEADALEDEVPEVAAGVSFDQIQQIVDNGAIYGGK